MPIPGMENLLPRQGEIKAARGWEPYFARPSLTQRCPCNFSSALGAPCQGVGRSPVKAGLAVASAGPAADQPLAPPGRACGWSVSPSPADGEARFDHRLGGCVGHMERWTSKGLGPSPGSPWWAVGVLDRM